MARTVRKSTGPVWMAAGAAMTLSVAALAQNAAADLRVAEMAIPAKPAMIEPGARQAKQQVMPTSQCGSSLGQFLKALTTPPNPFGSACGQSDNW